MATKFVYSGAVGLNDGTSWTDAWTSIASSTGVAAGDEIRVHKTHTQTGAINLTWTNGTAANPVKIYCVDKDASDVLATGAAVTCNSGTLTWGGFIVTDGLTLNQTAATSQISLGGGSNAVTQIYLNCTISQQTDQSIAFGGAPGQQFCLENCTLDMANAGGATRSILANQVGVVVLMRGGTVNARAAGHTTLFSSANEGSIIIVEGANIVNTITNVCTIASGRLWLKRCKLPTFTNLISAAPSRGAFGNCWAMLEGCKTGTLTVNELGLTWYEDIKGRFKSSLAQHRTGGANDGAQANAHSWEIVSNTADLRGVAWVEGPPMAVWVTAGAKTITVYVASGGTLQNDEFGIAVMSPNEIAPASTTAQANFRQTRLASRGTAANLTTDGTSTWNGSGVGTKQQVSVTVAPSYTGWVTVRPWLAKASTTVYVDPKPVAV